MAVQPEDFFDRYNEMAQKNEKILTGHTNRPLLC